MTGLIDRLAAALATEFVIKSELSSTSVSEKLTASRAQQHVALKALGKDASLNDILTAEKVVLMFELNQYANSKAMRSSLEDALFDLTITEKLVQTIQNPTSYKTVDESHARPKNRVGGLPRDEARQFFKSHWTRLLNQDKGRLDRLDKDIIDARRANMRTAEKQYIAMQQIALGITPEPPDKAREAGLGV